jgi:hypothetical protein
MVGTGEETLILPMSLVVYISWLIIIHNQILKNHRIKIKDSTSTRLNQHAINYYKKKFSFWNEFRI